MKIFDQGNMPTTGKLILLYGETGSGKTTSSYESLPDPILNIQAEPRNQRDQIRAAKAEKKEITIAIYENWMDLLKYLHEVDVSKYRTILFDGFSYLMNVLLSMEIEQEAFDARESKEKNVKPLVLSAKMSQEGFGGMASQMNRLMKRLGQFSQMGKIVVCTALLQENPKWNRDLAAAPALKGREFPSNMPGYFDLIGLVQKRFNEEKMPVYPPLVSFEGEGFLCKYTGVKKDPKKLAQGPLDFGKILGM